MVFVWFAVLVIGCTATPSSTEIYSGEPFAPTPVKAEQVSRVTTAVPFPRGLVLTDGTLYVLARGRVRESGGVDGAIDDHAGTIFAVNPDVGEPASAAEVSEAVKGNGRAFAAPTEPPFKLFDRSVNPPVRDRETDRPYCGLRYDPVTKNFFVCAFSGIDKPEGKGSVFSKNLTDGVHRFDTRTQTWHAVERHDIEKGGIYPHHDVTTRPPPHGWTNGPDNCEVVGKWLYVVAKDNSVLVRYDLSEIAQNPTAGPPRSEWVLGESIALRRAGKKGTEPFHLLGHSMLAYRDGFLYLGTRTTSSIVRLPMTPDGEFQQPMVAELVAQFDPYDSGTRKSANLTDMGFGPDGDLYVISAQPSRVFRFRPDPTRVFDGRTGAAPPWADLSVLTGNPKMKSENVLVDRIGRVFVTSGDAYAYQGGNGGTVYRIDP